MKPTKCEKCGKEMKSKYVHFSWCNNCLVALEATLKSWYAKK